jgi:hypothetical protein
MSAVPKQPAQADGITDPRCVNPSQIIQVSKAAHFRSQEWGNHKLALSALLDWVGRLKPGDKSNGEVWAPATLTGCRRLANMVEGVDLAVFDSDAGHTLAEIKARFEAVGWYARIIPSSSWGKNITEASDDHYKAWAAEQPDPDAEDLPERYLVEILRKTVIVAKGATVLNRVTIEEKRKDGGKNVKNLIRFRHGPCGKYRIICVLSERYDLSTPQARRAWKRHYDAMVDAIGLPFDRSVGSPERLFYLSYLSPDRLKHAGLHQATVEGEPIDISQLPEPKARERIRRGGFRTFAEDRVQGRGSDDEDIAYIWTDETTGKEIDLRAMAAKGLFQQLQLADVLQENGWPQDDRGCRDGKHHIECPFAHEHSNQNDGGTFVWNAADFAKTDITDLQPGAGIVCKHASCEGRDRLEHIVEFLRKGGLKTENLTGAVTAARDKSLDEDFDVIDPDISDPPPPSNRPVVDWVQWLRERMEIQAGHLRGPHLRRLRDENPDRYDEVCRAWREPHPDEDLDQLCDEAADDIPPKDDRTDNRGPQGHRLPDPFDPNQLPDRPWTLGARFMSGAVTVGIGVPGVGKSNFALLTAIGIASGRSLTGETVHRQGCVWVHNNEDDLVEMQRRVAGICKQHGIDVNLVRGNLVLSSGEDRKLVLAGVRDKDKKVKPTRAVDAFIQDLKENDVVHVVLDPFVSLHNGVDENDNAAMEEVLSIIRRIAKKANVSIDLIHHTVKDQGGDSEKRAGDMYVGRGASAIVGAARIIYTLSQMNKKTAEEFGIPEEQAVRYSRLDGAKLNHERRDGASWWFEMQSVNIRDDAGDLTALVSNTGEPLEDKEGPPRPPLTVGVHVPWDPTPARQAVEAQAVAAREGKKLNLAQVLAATMPDDRCTVKSMLGIVMEETGFAERKARDLINEAIPESDEGRVVQVDGRRCYLRRKREDDTARAKQFLVRDWIDPAEGE